MVNIYRGAVYTSCLLSEVPVYDYWVIDKQYPYIIISEITTDNIDLKLNERQDYSFKIDIFERSKGKAEIVRLVELIRANLMAIDGVKVSISTRYFSDVTPNVNHAIIVLTFTKYI